MDDCHDWKTMKKMAVEADLVVPVQQYSDHIYHYDEELKKILVEG